MVVFKNTKTACERANHPAKVPAPAYELIVDFAYTYWPWEMFEVAVSAPPLYCILTR